jgi:glycosyltransferase involved in cell wall biosynthesis
MKVACISASQIPSRTANSLQVMKACQALSQLGHEVHLYVPGYGQQPDDAELSLYYGLKSQFPIEWLPSKPAFHRYDFSFQAVRKAHKLNADVTYVWLIQAGIFSLLSQLPVIIELHGPPEGSFGPSIFRLFQYIPGKKRILPITHALANQIHECYNYDIENPLLARLSPNGVDLDHYMDLPEPKIARDVLGLPQKLTAGYTGHLYSGRGMSLLVELARCFPQFNFLWVGGNPSDVTKWREHLVIENISNITMTGFVQNSQLPLFQAAADILLMPYGKVISGSSGGNSATYASPMKMFEYMASNRAIISSDLPVIREVLNPANAVLCPPDDITAWSQALGCLMADENKRLSLGQQAWQDAQQYSWLERARNALAGFIVQ